MSHSLTNWTLKLKLKVAAYFITNVIVLNIPIDYFISEQFNTNGAGVVRKVAPSPPINLFPHGHLLPVISSLSPLPPPHEPPALLAASVWMSVTLKCFGKPCAERPCGRVSFCQALSTLVRTPQRKTHFFWCDRGAQKQSSSTSSRRTPGESNTGEPNLHRAGTKEPLYAGHFPASPWTHPEL